MEKMEWREPGPVSRPVGALREKLEALRSAPGEWAVLGEYANIQSATAVASSLQKRGNKPRGDFQFTSRSLASGRAELFGRYAPEEMNLG